MSKHAIDRALWTPQERDEYDDVIAEIVNATTDTRERLDLFDDKLADAIQAHRTWAIDVARSCRRAGLAKEISRFEARNRALVSHDGKLLSLPKVQARRVVTPTGEPAYQRELIEIWTWDQIRAKRAEALQQQDTYSAKLAHYDRLLALQDKAPDTASPSAAAATLGIDLDEWLGAAAA
jgi:hypothetical protein